MNIQAVDSIYVIYTYDIKQLIFTFSLVYKVKLALMTFLTRISKLDFSFLNLTIFYLKEETFP